MSRAIASGFDHWRALAWRFGSFVDTRIDPLAHLLGERAELADRALDVVRSIGVPRCHHLRILGFATRQVERLQDVTLARFPDLLRELPA